jgi:hypothetical protein
VKTISKGGAVLFAVVVSGVCIFWCTGQASIGSAASATAQQVRDDPSPLGVFSADRYGILWNFNDWMDSLRRTPSARSLTSESSPWTEMAEPLRPQPLA